MPVFVKAIISIVLVIFGIVFSNSAFFDENPLFGIEYLAEMLISMVLALVGFFIVPKAFFSVKEWFEKLIVKTTADIVHSFWEEYNRRAQEGREKKKREREEKKKNVDEAKKREQDLKNKLCGGILLDTSVLVDGRILDIAKTGFLGDKFVVPQFVLDELRLIADSKDTLKRKRGRRGFDVLKDLKKVPKTKVVIFDDVGKAKDVDKELVVLAKKCGVRVMTMDFNLAKAADVSGVRVLNINDLANAVKPVFIPGERMNLEVVQEGKGRGQGVGYLPDGTMVVVKDAKELISQEVLVEVTKTIQGSAGRMVFGKVVEEDVEGDESAKKKQGRDKKREKGKKKGVEKGSS